MQQRQRSQTGSITSMLVGSMCDSRMGSVSVGAMLCDLWERVGDSRSGVHGLGFQAGSFGHAVQQCRETGSISTMRAGSMPNIWMGSFSLGIMLRDVRKRTVDPSSPVHGL